MPVTIFPDPNYQGQPQELTEGQYDNALLQIPMGNDHLSSLKVSPGLVARLYAGWLFTGDHIDIKTDTPVLNPIWDNATSSILVYKENEEPSIRPYGPVIGIHDADASVTSGPGVYGESKSSNGVVGVARAKDAAGVVGMSERPAVDAQGNKLYPGPGVLGQSAGIGVLGTSKDWAGVFGESHGDGGPAAVWGHHHKYGPGVYGFSQSGIGILGKGGSLAGKFEGDVEVTGDIRLTNADCAEDFDVSEKATIDSGTVVVLGEEGKLEQCHKAYDKRVAGVVSGAGSYKPGIVLDKQESNNTRQPIALLGKVFCKVDSVYGAIDIGDLLTTSPTPGHAMKVNDPAKAFGTVIGKALRPFADGQGLIPILIALQ